MLARDAFLEPEMQGQAELTWVAGFKPRWFTRLLMLN